MLHKTAGTPGGELLDFWNGGANVLIGVCNLGKAKLFGSKTSGSEKCRMWSEIWSNKIIWGLIFLACHCPSHFS